MKEIRLGQIWLQYFKGIHELVLPLNGGVTDIYGANATGKTTIADAFRWLLFDKDSQDKSDFNIKTLDVAGKPINFLDHKVTAAIVINGVSKDFSKTYKEKWVKKRGESEKSFSGHETLYSIDDVPMQKKEYQAEIAKIIDEDTFKMLTDPFYFAQVVKWTDRRKTLLDICGDIEDTAIVNAKPKLSTLDLEGKSIEDFRKSVAAKRRKLNDELKAIPIRIDEATKSIKKDHDFTAIAKELKICEKELKEIEDNLNAPAPINPEVEKKRARIKEIRQELYDIESKINSEREGDISQLRLELGKSLDLVHSLKRDISDLSYEMRTAKKNLDQYSKRIYQLREAWTKINSESTRGITDEVLKECPTCKRPFDAKDVESKTDELIQNFNLDKAKRLQNNVDKGKELAEKLKDAKTRLVDAKELFGKQTEVLEISTELTAKVSESLQAAKESEIYLGEDYEKLEVERKELLEKVEELASQNDNSALAGLSDRKIQLTKEIDNLKSILIYQETNKEHETRIKQLAAEQKKIAQQVADIEKQEYLSEEFIRTKVELLEERINSKFKNVSFKLFDEQVNGALNEVCEVLVGGVPFVDANKAAKVNAGIDIINTLADHYGVRCPFFVDNAESVTELIPTNSQLIRLVVSPEHKKLTVA